MKDRIQIREKAIPYLHTESSLAIYGHRHVTSFAENHFENGRRKSDLRCNPSVTDYYVCSGKSSSAGHALLKARGKIPVDEPGNVLPLPVIELDGDEMSVFDVLPGFLPEAVNM